MIEIPSLKNLKLISSLQATKKLTNYLKTLLNPLFLTNIDLT